jgi:hypothetical protein
MSDPLGGREGARRRSYKGRHPLSRAAILLAGVGALYAVASAALAAAGAVPTAPVFFGLDVDNYYFWQMVFILPLVFAVWGLTAGILLATGKKRHARSAALVEAASALRVPLLFAWAPSAAQAVFMSLGMGQEEWVGMLSEPGVWQTIYLGIFLGACVCGIRNFVRAARRVHEKSWPAAVLTGVAASVVAGGAYIAFIR